MMTAFAVISTSSHHLTFWGPSDVLAFWQWFTMCVAFLRWAHTLTHSWRYEQKSICHKMEELIYIFWQLASEHSGTSISAEYQSIIVGVVEVIASLLAPFAFMKLGKRKAFTICSVFTLFSLASGKIKKSYFDFRWWTLHIICSCHIRSLDTYIISGGKKLFDEQLLFCSIDCMSNTTHLQWMTHSKTLGIRKAKHKHCWA